MLNIKHINLKTIFILLIINFILLIIFLIFSLRYSSCYIDSKIYGLLNCSEIIETENEIKISGFIKGIQSDSKEDVYIVLSIPDKQSIFDKKVKFLLGKKNASYIFLTIFKKRYDDFLEGNVEYEQLKLDNELIKKITSEKGKMIRLTIKKDLSKLKNINERDIDPKFREDLRFRKKYFNNCPFKITKNRLDSQYKDKRCGYLFVNSFEFLEE